MGPHQNREIQKLLSVAPPRRVYTTVERFAGASFGVGDGPGGGLFGPGGGGAIYSP